MKRIRTAVWGGVVLWLPFVAAAHPPITGQPQRDVPPQLDWPRDRPALAPDLTEPSANLIWDLHLAVDRPDTFDLAVSTSGNYHMALGELWHDHLLPNHAELIRNGFYSTSPPISPEQTAGDRLSFGNVFLFVRPQIAVGPRPVMDALIAADQTVGEPLPLFENYGNVLLVRKGNPKRIKGIWDLARPDVRFVTSNPETEPGSFGNYARSLYAIAQQNPDPQGRWTADRYFDTLFNALPRDNRWLAGDRIHHREVPWSVGLGRADAAPLFYHLARYMVATFPDRFEIVPLGGTAAAPEPLPGNRVAKLFAVRIRGDWTPRQAAATEALMELFASETFTEILERHHLRRPRPAGER
ncbi:MAG: substrate-binding domain-containing protein [Planctomycetota bacterium]